MRLRFLRASAARPAHLVIAVGLLLLPLLVLASGAQAAPGTCVSMTPGRLDCVAWDATRQRLIHVTDLGAGFGAPRDLPAPVWPILPLAPDPECVPRSRVSFVCFVIDLNGEMHGARFILTSRVGGHWEPTWEYFGGRLAAAPRCVMNSWTAVETTCFAIGQGRDVIFLQILEWPTERPGQIWIWGGWGGVVDELDCYESNYRHRKAVCVSRGTDGQLYRRDMPSVPGGAVPYWTWIPTTGARPSAGLFDCTTTPGHLAEPGREEWCAWRNSQGMLHLDIGEFAFDPARSLFQWGSRTLMSRPSCVSWSAGRLDCFYRGPDGQLHQLWGSGTGQLSPWSFPGQIVGAPRCTTRGPGTIDCVAHGTDRNWYHLGYRDGRGWVGWTRIGGPIR